MSASPKLPLVQVLRAVAALMVVIHHARHEASSLAPGSDVLALLARFPWMAGVDVFFVISGFIMVHASTELFGQRHAARQFLLRRLARIVPLYWLVTTLFLGVVVLKPAVLNSGPPAATEILASYLFWPLARADGVMQPVFSLGWTLNFEMLFYLIFAGALVLRRSAGVTVACIAMVLAGLVLWNRMAPQPAPFGFWGNPIVLEFAAGMGLGLLHKAGLRLGGLPRILLAGAGLVLFVIQGGETLATLEAVALTGTAAALLVAAAALAPEPPPDAPVHAPQPQAILLQAGVALGDASYALYLSHPFVLRLGREAFVRLGLSSPSLFLAAMPVAACLVALCIYRWFERPVTRLTRTSH